MPSPICLVKDGAGANQATTSGVNVTPGNTVTISLNSAAGVNTWQITCIYTDETTGPSSINSGLTVNNVSKTATFTAPATGKAMIFQSVINGGLGPDGLPLASYTTTFGVFTLTAGGLRTVAVNQTFEGDPTYGWAGSINPIIRNPSGAAPTGSDTEVQTKNGSALAGATNVKAGSGYLAIGATVPTTGTIRLADGSSVVATTGGTDRPLLTYSAGNLTVGDATVISSIINRVNSSGLIYNQSNGVNVWTIGPNGAQFNSSSFALGGGVGVIGIANATTAPGSVPTSGAVLYSEGGLLKSRSSVAGSTAVTLSPYIGMFDGTVNRVVAAQSGGEVFIGCDSAYTSGTQATSVRVYGNSFVYMGTGSATRFIMDNTATWPLMTSSGSTLYIGTNAGFTNQASNVNMYVASGGNIGIGNSGSTYLYINGTSTNVEFARPIGGGSYGANIPLRLASSSISATAGSTTLTTAQYANPYLYATGSPGGAFTWILPNVAGAMFIVTNATGQTMSINTTIGTAISLTTNVTAVIVCDPAGNYRITR